MPELPTIEVPLPGERTSKAFEEATDVASFRRYAGLNEEERKGDLMALASLLKGNAEALIKALHKDAKQSALKTMTLMAGNLKKIAQAYALDSAVDAAENFADALDVAARKVDL